MHRVELKGRRNRPSSLGMISVPNAPCGVESLICNIIIHCSSFVPNAPCGVESKDTVIPLKNFHLVPNAPCGVERTSITPPSKKSIDKFLMHRVELKGQRIYSGWTDWATFLMHRVELKAYYSPYKTHLPHKVPNAPCGVERKYMDRSKYKLKMSS